MVRFLKIGHMARLAAGGDQPGTPDPTALAAARVSRADPQHRLDTYFSAHSARDSFEESLLKVASLQRWLVRGLIVFSLVTGAAAASAAFSSGSSNGVFKPSTLNVFWLFAAFLGTHCISIGVWLVLLLRRKKPGPSGLTGSLIAFATRLLSKKEDSLVHATQASVLSDWSGRAGFWRASKFSHLAWLIYLVSGLITAALFLSFQRYSFIWETTLLSAETAVSIIHGLGAIVGLFGLSVPTAADILAAQNLGQGAASGQNAQSWAQFCLACVAVYGVLPRLALWLLSKAIHKRSAANAHYPTEHVFFAGLLARIYQPEAKRSIVDADTLGRPDRNEAPMVQASEKHHDTAATFLGWEIEDTAAEGLTLSASFERADALLDAVKAAPQDICLVVSLLTTPDRGVRAALQPAIEQRPDIAVTVVGQSRLKQRMTSLDVERRIADWWSLLTHLGVDGNRIMLGAGAIDG